LLGTQSCTRATDQTWQTSWIFQGDKKLEEFGKKSPDAICVGIVGTVDKPGIYWVPKETLSLLLENLPTRYSKDSARQFHLLRRDGSLYAFGQLHEHDAYGHKCAASGPGSPCFASTFMLEPDDVLDFIPVLTY
jgi:hypothetical protein